MVNERRELALRRLRELAGPKAQPDMEEPLIAMAVEHVFGDVWSRPGLQLRERSLMTCAVLVAMGLEDELRFHLNGALHIGISSEAIEEIMIHTAQYSGWPCAVKGLRIAQKVIAEYRQ